MTIATSDITVGNGKTLNVSSGTLTLSEGQINGSSITDETIDLTSKVTGELPINNFATKNENNFASNSSSHVPTQSSVKAYVDSVASGLDVKESRRIATTENITLTGIKTIDGNTTSVDDRILVKDQTTASENGIYICKSSCQERSSDFDENSEVTSGAFTFVEVGNVNADNWFCINYRRFYNYRNN